jgi:hypothetical protein
MELTHTISILEVLWTVIVTIGLFIIHTAYDKVLGDLDALRLKADYIIGGPREILAKIRIRTERMKMTTMLGFLLIGISAMTAPASAAGPLTPTAILLTVVFIGGAIAMVADTFFYIRDREKIKEVLDIQHNTEPAVGNVVLNKDNKTGILTVPIKLKIENPIVGHADIRTSNLDDVLEIVVKPNE